MVIYQDYEKYCSDFTYLDVIVKEVISILDGSGKSQIIIKDIIKDSNKKVKDFIILSAKMESALNFIYDQLKEIKNSKIKFSGGMFYFCRYGGSKTQYLNLVLNEIQERIPDCIIIMFEDITELTPLKLFNKLKQSAYYTIPHVSRFKNNETLFISLLEKLESLSADINVDLRQSSNLNTIVQKIGYVKNRLNKNPKLRDELIETMELIRTSIFVDSESIMKKILEMMKELTRQGFIFLFLYDELDLWIDDTSDTDQLYFSESFRRLEKILKYIFEISQHEIKLFHLFACTERVNKLIEENKYIYSESSFAGSRLMHIYDQSYIVLEQGSYGDKIEEALAKISAFYHHSNDGFKIEEKFLINSLDQFKEKYSSYSRRLANDQIIKMLKIYHNLKLPLEKGLKEWINNVKRYGDLIHIYIDRILKEIEIQFIREDVPIEPEKEKSDKIDGYFINYDEEGNEIKTYAEIKVTKKYTDDKAYQAIQWSQVRKEPIVMIIFSPDDKESIQEQNIKYAEKNGFTAEETKRIKILNISIPYAFCPIIGVESVLSNHSKLVEFYRNYAVWLDFFGDFNRKYQELRTELGFTYKKAVKPPESIGDKAGKRKAGKELPLEAKLCMELLVKLYTEKKMDATGKLAKTTIENTNKKYSLGISNIENLYEIMENHDVIANITNKQIHFSEDILKIDKVEDFIKVCENKFRKRSEDLLSYA